MRFTFVAYVSHTINVLVTDIILNITSREHLTFTSLQIGSRLFELFGKEVRIKKQPGMSLSHVSTLVVWTCRIFGVKRKKLCKNY